MEDDAHVKLKHNRFVKEEGSESPRPKRVMLLESRTYPKLEPNFIVEEHDLHDSDSN